MFCGDRFGGQTGISAWLAIRPSFSAPSRSKRDVRAKLGLDVEAPTVMLVGGGEGMGKLKETAVALSQTCV